MEVIGVGPCNLHDPTPSMISGNFEMAGNVCSIDKLQKEEFEFMDVLGRKPNCVDRLYGRI